MFITKRTSGEGQGSREKIEGTDTGFSSIDSILFLKLGNIFTGIHFKILLHNLHIILVIKLGETDIKRKSVSKYTDSYT